MTPAPFDFRKPPPLPAAQRNALADWLPRVCQYAARQLAGQVPFPVEMEPAGLEVAVAKAALEALPESCLRFRAPLAAADNRVASVAPSNPWSLLVLPRPFALALIAGLLGEAVEQPTADTETSAPAQELTPVEEDVSDFVAREFFLEPLQQAWPLTPRLRLDAPQRLAARSAPPFLPDSFLLVASFRARGPFGEQTWQWMLPRAAVEPRGGGGFARVPSRAEREAFVQTLPVRMTVNLGGATLPLIHLASLQVGDVLLLEQPVNQPLTASLGEQVKFLVWPGAVGARQAVAIHAAVRPQGPHGPVTP